MPVEKRNAKYDVACLCIDLIPGLFYFVMTDSK